MGYPEEIICFFHEYEKYGCFSNWYKSNFEYAGKIYSCVEQFMMYQKVLIFHQFELANKIMKETDPAIIKKIGRTPFDNFNPSLWNLIGYTVVKRAVRAKFEQNKDILTELLATNDSVLVECSPTDKKWGIGIAIYDSRCYSPKEWNGKNYLGRILMEVRDELRHAEFQNTIGFLNAMDVEFPLWNQKAGNLFQHPKYHRAIKAYTDTLIGDYERDCFFYSGTLSEWEEAMRTNMGGGLPVIGFYEMKQEIYDIVRLRL